MSLLARVLECSEDGMGETWSGVKGLPGVYVTGGSSLACGGDTSFGSVFGVLELSSVGDRLFGGASGGGSGRGTEGDS